LAILSTATCADKSDAVAPVVGVTAEEVTLAAPVLIELIVVSPTRLVVEEKFSRELNITRLD
jgi:hypothetical protein